VNYEFTVNNPLYSDRSDHVRGGDKNFVSRGQKFRGLACGGIPHHHNSHWINTISTSATGRRWVSGPQNPPRPPPPLDDVNPLLQTVYSNILILLQFISCVAVHTTSMSLQVAGPAETFVTQRTLVRLLSRVDSHVII